MIPDKAVDLEKGLYHCVYLLLHFNNWYGVDRKGQQEEIKADPDKQKMDDTILNDERDHNRKMFFQDKDIWIDGKRALINANI